MQVCWNLTALASLFAIVSLPRGDLDVSPGWCLPQLTDAENLDEPSCPRSNQLKSERFQTKPHLSFYGLMACPLGQVEISHADDDPNTLPRSGTGLQSRLARPRFY